MNCHYCQGIDTYQQVKTKYFSPSHEQSFFVENFPVSECVQCGEQIISSAAMDVLDSIHNGDGHPISFERIPVYDHDDLAGESRRWQSTFFAKMPNNDRFGSFTGSGGVSLVDPTLYVIIYGDAVEHFRKHTLESLPVASRLPEVRYPAIHHAPLTAGSILT